MGIEVPESFIIKTESDNDEVVLFATKRYDRIFKDNCKTLNGMSVPSLMELCKVLDIDADYILFGTVTRSKNNPINNIITKMTPQQSLHAEEILMAYAKSCNIK